jgi:hypothetical protein
MVKPKLSAHQEALYSALRNEMRNPRESQHMIVATVEALANSIEQTPKPEKEKIVQENWFLELLDDWIIPAVEVVGPLLLEALAML